MRDLSLKLIAFGMVICQSLAAQETDSSTNDSEKEKPVRKHEVGVSLNPLTTYSDPSGHMAPVFINYKYTLNKFKLNSAIEFGTSYIDNSISNINNSISLDDTIAIYQYSESSRDRKILRLGIETLKENKLLEFIFGLDLLLGLEYHFTHINEEYYNIETGNSVDYPLSTTNTNTLEDTYLALGITPFFGINIKATDRISAGILLPVDIYNINLMKTNKIENPVNSIVLRQNIQIMFNLKL